MTLIATDSTSARSSFQARVDRADWDAARAGLEEYGCGSTGPLLMPDEASEIAALYDDESRFRSTVNMARHRFGKGEYRYFAEPFPSAVKELKRALYPRLLPIAKDWWSRLGRHAPWPDASMSGSRCAMPPGRLSPRPSC
jgi:hypothetical protein